MWICAASRYITFNLQANSLTQVHVGSRRLNFRCVLLHRLGSAKCKQLLLSAQGIGPSTWQDRQTDRQTDRSTLTHVSGCLSLLLTYLPQRNTDRCTYSLYPCDLAVHDGAWRNICALGSHCWGHSQFDCHVHAYGAQGLGICRYFRVRRAVGG